MTSQAPFLVVPDSPGAIVLGVDDLQLTDIIEIINGGPVMAGATLDVLGQYFVGPFVNVLSYGAKGDGVTDDTDAIQAALDVGGYVVFPSGKNYLVSNLILSVVSTVEFVGDATLIDAAGTTGTMFSVTVDGCTLRNFRATITQSPALGTGLLITANNTLVDSPTINGKPFNPLLPNATYEPHNGIYIGDATHHYVNNTVRSAYGRGGFNCIVCQGGMDVTIDSPDLGYCQGFGFIGGNTLPITRLRIISPRYVNCGYYGESLSNITSAGAFSPYPISGMISTGGYHENNGHLAYYIGQNGSVGTPKLAVDLTSTGMEHIYWQGMAVNCGSGGVEAKYTQAPPFTITPSGAHGIEIHLQNFVNYNPPYLYAAWAPVIGSSGPASTDLSNIQCYGTALMAITPAWSHGTTGVWKKPWDMVSSGGNVWQCFGDRTGQPGLTGTTAPTGGAAVTLSLLGSAAIGASTFTFTDTTGVVDGAIVFAGPKLPDGCTVLSHDATTVTVSGALTSGLSSGESIVFAKRVFDGNLYWVTFTATDTSATPTNTLGLSLSAGANITARIEVTNFAYGVLANFYNSTTNNIYNLKVHLTGRNLAAKGFASTTSSGSGGFIGLVLEGDIETSGEGVYISNSGTTNTGVDLRNLRVRAGTYGIRLLGGSLTTTKLNDCDIYGTVSAVLVAAAGTTEVKCGGVQFEAGSGISAVPCQFNGAGTWTWGAGSQIQNNNTLAAGWVNAGAMTVRGRVLRTDLTTAPGGGTLANIGEYMELAAPTASEQGYLCQAVDSASNPTAMTWKKIPLS